MSSDSYYYVMQYGEVVAKVGSLNFDTAGATMTWTGVSSALISSLAYFCGFETITVIHNLLVISMLICFYLMMKKQISNLGARDNPERQKFKRRNDYKHYRKNTCPNYCLIFSGSQITNLLFHH